MAINVNEFKEFIETISNKDENGGYSVSQFNSALAVVVGAYVDKLKQSLRNYQLSPNKNYALISKYERYLLEITKKSNISVASNGLGAFPIDWNETIGLNYIYVTQNPLKAVPYPIRECTKNEFSAYEVSQLNKPTKKKALATYYDGKILFSPKDLLSAEVIYYTEYETPFWGYIVRNNQEVYTSGVGVNGKSVNIPLAPQCNNDLAFMMCQYLGVSIKEAFLEQFSQQEEAKAQ